MRKGYTLKHRVVPMYMYMFLIYFVFIYHDAKFIYFYDDYKII